MNYLLHDANDGSHFILKPYNTRQLAELYAVNCKTIYNWLRHSRAKIGKRIGYYYHPRQVLRIITLLGEP
jgi:hypothetical protein